MMTIAESNIQPVPASFHNLGLPDWVSNIAIFNRKGEATTILMLNINLAFSQK